MVGDSERKKEQEMDSGWRDEREMQRELETKKQKDRN